jgi:hypothetical protein
MCQRMPEPDLLPPLPASAARPRLSLLALDAGSSWIKDTGAPPGPLNDLSSTTRMSAGCCGLATWRLISSKPLWRGASLVP